MKKELATLVLGLAGLVGSANAETIVHQSEHYQFLTRDTGLTGIYLYARNFTEDIRYNPNSVASGMGYGFGISGRLHQQYFDFGEEGIVGTPTQSGILDYFKSKEEDSHWIFDSESSITALEPTENYNVWESDLLPELKDEYSNEIDQYLGASFGDSMQVVYKNMFINDRELPIAYIVTDDLSSINCSMWIGRNNVEPIGELPEGYVASASSLAYGDNVSFNLNPIPEPSTLATLVLGGSALLNRRKK